MKKIALLIAVLAPISACKKRSGDTIQIDGSSTVYLLSEAVAEEFKGAAQVLIAQSGTGGGFKKFCRGEIEISGASRPIKSTEADECKKANIEFIELPVAYDGLAVVIHPSNTWAASLTVEELKLIWSPESQGKISNWNQVRPGFPDKKLTLYGAGVDSGTFDYFTAAIVGKEHSSRGDYTASENDNALVTGVAKDEGALGYFGYAYYVQNKDKLQLVAIDDGKAENGAGPVLPSKSTVIDGTYQPLSRPIFIYVAKSAAERPAVKEFVEFYITHSSKDADAVGYVPLPDSAYKLVSKRFAELVTGSVFSGSKVGVSVDQLLSGK